MTYQIYPGAKLYFEMTPEGAPAGSMCCWVCDSNKNLYMLTAGHNTPLGASDGTIKVIHDSKLNKIISDLNTHNSNCVIRGVGGVGVCDAALVNLNSIKNNLVKDNFAIGGVLVNGFLSGFGANPVVNTSLQMWNSITDANMGPVGVFQCQVADILNPSQNPIQMTVKVLNGNQAGGGNSGTCVYDSNGIVYGLLSQGTKNQSYSDEFFAMLSSNIQQKVFTENSLNNCQIATWANKNAWT
ncbi:MAG: hypothetical protein U0T79_02905 [Ferruginibacter sp.]